MITPLGVPLRLLLQDSGRNSFRLILVAMIWRLPFLLCQMWVSLVQYRSGDKLQAMASHGKSRCDRLHRMGLAILLRSCGPMDPVSLDRHRVRRLFPLARRKKCKPSTVRTAPMGNLAFSSAARQNLSKCQLE